MKACFMGLGYIGLPTAIIAAKSGIDVVGVDINEKVVEQTNAGHLHIVEPGLEDLLQDVIKSGLFKAKDVYPEMSHLEGFIDLERCYVLNTTGRWWLLKSFWTHLELLRFLRKGRFSTIHLAWPPNIYEWVLYWLRRRMVLTVHDPLPHSDSNTFVVRLRRWLAFHLIPRFILLNTAQRQTFIDTYHLKDSQVIQARMSCCTYLHTVVPATEGIPAAGSYVLFAGRISAYKGLDYLLPAMEQVHRQCPDMRLVVAGSGSFHFDVSRYRQLDYVDIRNRFIPDSELVALIKGCAFMVCPYTDATQSGVVMSAFAFAKPVIATNVGGLPEMVVHGHYGLIVKERDTEALAQAMTTLWQQPDTVKAYAAEIERDYRSGELSWHHTAQTIVGEYRIEN